MVKISPHSDQGLGREVSQCDTAGETSVVKNQITGKEERHSRANGSQVCDEVATGKSCTTTPNQVMSGVLACSALRQSYRDILISGGQNCDGFKVSCMFVVLCGKEDTILATAEEQAGALHASISAPLTTGCSRSTR